jgi:phosphate transport system substrate-binding protein
MIGVIGVNWLTQPLPDMQIYVDNVALSVKGFKRMDIISHHKII